jgi:hypothetical protein
MDVNIYLYIFFKVTILTIDKYLNLIAMRKNINTFKCLIYFINVSKVFPMELIYFLNLFINFTSLK